MLHSPFSIALTDRAYASHTVPSQLLQMSIVGASVEQPLAAVPGGVLVRDASNNIVGAVGVSGASVCVCVGDLLSSKRETTSHERESGKRKRRA